jgi:DNA-binding MarR family transcriptional regulator
MRALAATMNCDPSTISFITDRLEQRGLIQRQVDPADRRVKVITLTPQGVAARTRFVQSLAMGSSLARLSPDEQRHLHGLLAKAGADPAKFTCTAPVPTNPHGIG